MEFVKPLKWIYNALIVKMLNLRADRFYFENILHKLDEN